MLDALRCSIGIALFASIAALAGCDKGDAPPAGGSGSPAGATPGKTVPAAVTPASPAAATPPAAGGGGGSKCDAAALNRRKVTRPAEVPPDPQKVALYAEQCQSDKWPDKMIDCYIAAKDKESADKCEALK